MARTDWSQVVYDKQLATAKSVHKKLFVTQKILASELPEYIDAGWEKCKDYKSPKHVGIAKEKPVDEQFEDRIWLMFAGMGFYGLNAENGILISYDFSNDDLKELAFWQLMMRLRWLGFATHQKPSSKKVLPLK